MIRKIMIAVALVLVATGCTATTESAAPSSTPSSPTTEPSASDAPSPPPSPEPSTSTPGSSPPTAGSLSNCAETRRWNTAGETSAPYSTDALYLVRAGRHDCYDRVVLDVNGSADVGYAVEYVPVVAADGSGEPYPVAGRAALRVIVHAPPLGFDMSGHQPGRELARAGDYFYTADQLAGWRSLRAVRFAGYFEGQSTVAIGVSAKLPFRVFTQLDTTDQVRRVVIDVAHR